MEAEGKSDGGDGDGCRGSKRVASSEAPMFTGMLCLLDPLLLLKIPVLTDFGHPLTENQLPPIGNQLPLNGNRLAPIANQLPLTGRDIQCLGKSESANSGATKRVPFLKSERTNFAGLAKDAHDKQWTVTVISWWTLDGCCSFLVDSGWLLLFLVIFWFLGTHATSMGN